MNMWFKKLVCGFVTVLILGTVFSPSLAFAQPLLEGLNGETAEEGDTVGNPADLPVFDQNNSSDTTTETNQQLIANTGSNYQDAQTGLPECGIGLGDGTVEGCFVRIIYYVTLYPSAWIASIAGQIFDYFIAYSLGSEAYEAGGFVTKGWTVLRDIANASFIFMLLYIAITLVVNSKSANMKLLTRVILIAVVINFSLFMTRVIVDAGNILGRVFYEKTVVENDDTATSTGYTTLSAGLIKHVSPQKLLSSDMFKKKYEATPQQQNTLDNSLGSLSSSGGYDGEISTGFLILILLIATLVNLAIAWIFVSVSIFFLGRTLGLWIMMIMSPVAFASWSIPALASKLPKYGFNNWLSKTASLSFMPVVFMFFLYLTVMFIDVAFGSVFSVFNQPETASTTQKIMSVIVPAAAIIFLLKLAKEQAKDMSGEFGDMVGKGIKTAVKVGLGAAGLGLGAVAGVGAIAGRQILGRAGAALARNANTSTAGGRIQRRLGNRMSRSTYDTRNVRIPQPITNTLRSGLSYATDGAVGANDFRLTQMNTLTGRPDTRGYTQRREEYARQRIQRAGEFRVGEDATITTGPTSYTHVDTSGNRSTRTINPTSISASQAQAQVVERERALNVERERVHRDNDYEAKKQILADRQKEHEKEVEKQKKDLDAKEKIYKEMIAEKQAGNTSITDADIARARTDRDNQKIEHDREIQKTKQKVDDAKRDVESIEVLYRDQENQLEEARAISTAASRALSNRNAEVLNNYADSIDTWAAFPDAGLTHRYGANRDAAEQIRNTANRQRT